MWTVRVKIVSVIIGALATIKKGLDEKLHLFPGQTLATDLQKNTLMGTA